MKLVGRVPVEPLDDERLTNIERRVVAGAADAAARPIRAPRRSSHYLGFAAAAMAAMVAGVIGWKLRGAPVQAPVVAEAPLQVSTDAHGGTLAIGDATIQSDPSTVFAVTRPDGGVLVELSRGRVALKVAKRGNRPPLVVRAGDTDVIVVGTQFSVDYGDGTGEVDVRVTEGVVKVVRHHQEVRVAIGQAWETPRGVIALADARPPRTIAAPVGATGPTGEDGATGATGGGAAVAIGDAVPGPGSAGYEIDMGAGPDVLHGRTAQVPDQRTTTTAATTRTGGGASTTRSGGGDTRSGSGSGSGSQAGATGSLDLRDLRALIKRQPVTPPIDVGETVAATAVSKYEEIIRNHTTGEEESRAYYGIAYTQALELGRTGDALQTIGSYERRFAQGRVYPERVAIAWLKVRITCDRPQPQKEDDCRQAAARYERLAPDSPAGRIAERINLRD